MMSRTSHRIATAVLAGCLAGGLATTVLGGPAAARVPADDPVIAPVHDAGVPPAAEGGLASMSSPYVPGVPHVPADVILALGPGGSSDGARFIGPPGSLFDGPVDEVAARVDAWWAEQMANGVSPEEADELLAHPRR